MATTTRRPPPRRGEPGFAAYARSHGGDPRLQEARAQRQQLAPVAESPSGTGARQRASRSRQQPAQQLGQARVPATKWTVNDASGFVLGAFAWVLVVQYLDAGPAGIRNWLRAKFLNKGPKGEALP